MKDTGPSWPRGIGKGRRQIRRQWHLLPLLMVMMMMMLGSSVTINWREAVVGFPLCHQTGFSAHFLRKQILGVSGSLLELDSFPIVTRPKLNGEGLFILPSFVGIEGGFNPASCLRLILQVFERSALSAGRSNRKTHTIMSRSMMLRNALSGWSSASRVASPASVARLSKQ